MNGEIVQWVQSTGRIIKGLERWSQAGGALGWASMKEKQLGCANSYLASAPPLWVPQESTLTVKRQNSLSSPAFWASSSTLASALPSWLSIQATTYCFQCGDCICWQHWSLPEVHPFICCLFKLSPSEFILLFPRSHVTDTPRMSHCFLQDIVSRSLLLREQTWGARMQLKEKQLKWRKRLKSKCILVKNLLL